MPRAIFSSITLPTYDPTKEPKANTIILNGFSFKPIITLPVTNTQISAITNPKIAPNNFFPLDQSPYNLI